MSGRYQIERLVDPTGNVTTLNHDARQLTGIAFPTFTQTVAYDDDNRFDTVTNVLGAGSDQTTALTYDDVGNLIATLDAEGNSYSYTVDALDRITAITDPVSGTIEFDYDRRGNFPDEADLTSGAAVAFKELGEYFVKRLVIVYGVYDTAVCVTACKDQGAPLPRETTVESYNVYRNQVESNRCD